MPRHKPIPYEHNEQVALFEWFNWQQHKYPELQLAFAIPNGGLRFMGTAIKLKSEGVKAGVPDIFIPVPRSNYHGLFIEMKYGNNKPSALQVDWIDRLQKQGYFTAICYGFEEAKNVVTKYMELSLP